MTTTAITHQPAAGDDDVAAMTLEAAAARRWKNWGRKLIGSILRRSKTAT
jgi:hypothetical protein